MSNYKPMLLLHAWLSKMMVKVVWRKKKIGERVSNVVLEIRHASRNINRRQKREERVDRATALLLLLVTPYDPDKRYSSSPRCCYLRYGQALCPLSRQASNDGKWELSDRRIEVLTVSGVILGYREQAWAASEDWLLLLMIKGGFAFPFPWYACLPVWADTFAILVVSSWKLWLTRPTGESCTWMA